MGEDRRIWGEKKRGKSVQFLNWEEEACVSFEVLEKLEPQ